MGMVDGTARLAVHARDFAVLGLVVGDDCGKAGRRQLLAELIPDDGAQPIEQLALVKPGPPVAADLSNDSVEIVERDILLGNSGPAFRAVGFANGLALPRPASRQVSWAWARAPCRRRS